MVTYPTRPGNGKPGRPGIVDRPATLPAPGTRPGIGDRPGIGNRPGGGNLPGIGHRPGGGYRPSLSRPSTRPIKDRDWNSNKWGGNHGIWGNGNQINIKINNKFKNSYNYSYRPNYWGGRPWWGAGHCHRWHHGHWGYGWNSHYYRRHWWCDDDNFSSGFMWGIAVWSLGNLIYDMGYQTYRNPYPAPPVQNTYITYAQPVSVAAAANPPGDEKAVELAETKSNEAMERSRNAFKMGDYLAASKAVDEALGYTPGDVTLHEYRALVFFALGKYSDAAGVLNPVLASGPGWSWDTMVGFYNDSETYSGQLRKLEAYVKGSPDKADGHFLLGYHYMVCGYMDKANAEFSKASELQPADSISRQLRDLTADSIPDAGGSETESEPPARPDPVPPEKLVGTWVSDRGADGKVTFTMTPDGNYTWNYMSGGQSSELKGTYALDDKGLLVLSSDDSQMISEVVLKDDKQLQFTLIGAPDGDPGLEFVKN
jgi:tetratricopeptide (TPR) repeat protein